MEIFAKTVGVSPEFIASFIKWLLSAVVVIFGFFVAKGSYQRWLDDDMTGADVFIDVALAMAIVTAISLII